MAQMLRQGDARVFKRYTQAKLNIMMREAFDKLDRHARKRKNYSNDSWHACSTASPFSSRLRSGLF